MQDTGKEVLLDRTSAAGFHFETDTKRTKGFFPVSISLSQREKSKVSIGRTQVFLPLCQFDPRPMVRVLFSYNLIRKERISKLYPLPGAVCVDIVENFLMLAEEGSSHSSACAMHIPCSLSLS